MVCFGCSVRERSGANCRRNILPFRPVIAASSSGFAAASSKRALRLLARLLYTHTYGGIVLHLRLKRGLFVNCCRFASGQRHLRKPLCVRSKSACKRGAGCLRNVVRRHQLLLAEVSQQTLQLYVFLLQLLRPPACPGQPSTHRTHATIGSCCI